MSPRVLILCAVFAATRLGAQTVERPVPLDSAGRILTVNPALARRIHLDTPAWPVQGEYVEAKAYESSAGGYVLSVQRERGTYERFALTPEQFVALRGAVTQALAQVGRVVAEDAASIISEPARAPFVRDQTFLAAAMYGPALAALTHDGETGTAAYLATVGGTFFALSAASQGRQITRAQNSMATDGALRAYAFSSAFVSAAEMRIGSDGRALMALASGIGGSALGFARGTGLTNAEAHAAMTGSTIAGLTAIGAAFGTGVAKENSGDEGRNAARAFLIGAVPAYALGPLYVRRAPYTVTAGDIGALRLSTLLGAAILATPFTGKRDPQPIYAAATVGAIAGTIVGDRTLVRRFNYTQSESRMMTFGLVGGALIGSIPSVFMADDNNVALSTGLTTAGALFGTIATQSILKPARAEDPYVGGESRSGNRLSFDPGALLMSAARVPGRHTVLSLRF